MGEVLALLAGIFAHGFTQGLTTLCGMMGQHAWWTISNTTHQVVQFGCYSHVAPQ